jgi:diguanylate cyclase (GGDEF)-like protein
MLGSISPRDRADGLTALAPLAKWMLLESAYGELAAPLITRFVPAVFIAAIPALTGQLWALAWLLAVLAGFALGRPAAAAFERQAATAERDAWVRRYRLVAAAQSACLGAGGLLAALDGSMPACLLAAAAIGFALCDVGSDPFASDAAHPRIALLTAPLVLGAVWRATQPQGGAFFLYLAGGMLVWAAGSALLSRGTASRLDAITAAMHKMPAPVAHGLRAQTPADQDFRRLLGRDQITGLPNRHSFMRLLALESERAVLAAAPLTLLLVAWIGHEEHVDDHLRAAADAALGDLAKCLSSTLRRRLDVIASLGYGNFGLLLPATDAYGGDAVAKTVVAAILRDHFGDEAAPAESPVKIGCATYRGKGPLAENDLLEFAEEALRHVRATPNQCIRHYDPTGKATRPPPFKGKRPKEETRFSDSAKPPRLRARPAAPKPVGARARAAAIEAPAAAQAQPDGVLPLVSD